MCNTLKGDPEGGTYSVGSVQCGVTSRLLMNKKQGHTILAQRFLIKNRSTRFFRTKYKGIFKNILYFFRPHFSFSCWVILYSHLFSLTTAHWGCKVECNLDSSFESFSGIGGVVRQEWMGSNPTMVIGGITRQESGDRPNNNTIIEDQIQNGNREERQESEESRVDSGGRLSIFDYQIFPFFISEIETTFPIYNYEFTQL